MLVGDGVGSDGSHGGPISRFFHVIDTPLSLPQILQCVCSLVSSVSIGILMLVPAFLLASSCPPVSSLLAFPLSQPCPMSYQDPPSLYSLRTIPCHHHCHPIHRCHHLAEFRPIRLHRRRLWSIKYLPAC